MIARQAIAAAFTLAGVSIATAQVEIAPLAATGGPAPGFPPGAALATIRQPSSGVFIGDGGHVAFAGTASGAGITTANDEGAWLVSRSSFVLLVRESDPAPALGSDIAIGRINTVLSPAADGSVIVWTGLTGSSVTAADDSALWRCRAGAAPELIFREGDTVPGFPAPLGPIRSMLPYNDSEAVMRETFSGGTGMAITTPAGLVPIALPGDLAPGTSAAMFSSIPTHSCASAGSAFGFNATVVGGDTNAGNDTGLWAYSPAIGLQLIAREGDPAPGISGDITFFSLSNGSNALIGDEGGSFVARLAGTGIDTSNDYAIYRVSGATLSLVIREGVPAPHLAPDVLFASPESVTPAGNDIFALSQLTGPSITTQNNIVLWRFGAQGTTLLARKGEQAADAPPGTLYDYFGFFGNDARFVTNPSGRLIVPIRLLANLPAQALYMTDPLGRLRKITQVGDALPLPAGGVGTVSGYTAAAINRSGDAAALISLAPGTPSAIYLVHVGCPISGCDGFDLEGADCRVDLQDLAMLLADFGGIGANLPGDTDHDGDVDLQDLAGLLAVFGNDCSGG